MNACIDCRYCEQNTLPIEINKRVVLARTYYYCHHPEGKVPTTEIADQCEYARFESGHCGPEGKHWKAK